MTLRLNDLARTVAKETGQPIYKTEATLWAAFNALARLMAKGEKISIPNFGNFSMHERPERLARNPQTGDTVTVPARRVPYYKPSGRNLDIVNDGDTTATIRKSGNGNPPPKRGS